MAQYAERVWGISRGDTLTKAELAINKTEDFFQSLDIPTHLSDYTAQFQGTAEKVSESLSQRGWVALGEHKDITPDKVKSIIEDSY